MNKLEKRERKIVVVELPYKKHSYCRMWLTITFPHQCLLKTLDLELSFNYEFPNSNSSTFFFKVSASEHVGRNSDKVTSKRDKTFSKQVNKH